MRSFHQYDIDFYLILTYSKREKANINHNSSIYTSKLPNRDMGIEQYKMIKTNLELDNGLMTIKDSN